MKTFFTLATNFSDFWKLIFSPFIESNILWPVFALVMPLWNYNKDVLCRWCDKGAGAEVTNLWGTGTALRQLLPKMEAKKKAVKDVMVLGWLCAMVTPVTFIPVGLNQSVTLLLEASATGRVCVCLATVVPGVLEVVWSGFKKKHQGDGGRGGRRKKAVSTYKTSHRGLLEAAGEGIARCFDQLW